jgi:hypothetical protein
MAQQDWFAANAPKADGGDWFAKNAPSAASSITPPKMTVGAPASQPMTQHYLIGGGGNDPVKPVTESVGDVASGMVKNVGYLAAMTPTIVHRGLQKQGIAPEGDVFPGEHTAQEVQEQDVPNAAMTVMTGAAEGMEAEPRPLTARPATPRGRTVAEPPSTAGLDPETQAKYTAALDKANKAHGEALADHAVKEAEARAKWVDKAAGAKRGAAAAEAATNKKAALERGSQEYTRLTHDNLQHTYQAARGSLDQRWDQFRTVMQGEQLDPVRAYESVEDAKTKYLKGSPSSLKVFNDLTGEIGIQKINEEGEVITPKGENGEVVEVELPFDTGRVHYSAIGDRLSQGTLPGNVYQALKAVSEDLDAQLTDAAEGRGLGKEYTALKSNEHQFRSDWKDSHSPLAKAYKAQDPNFLAGHVTGKGADLLMKQLARYREFGAKPYLPAAARRLSLEADAVPRVRVPETPAKYKAPTAPELKPVERPTPKTKTTKAPSKGTIGRTAARIGGKLVGAKVGGFPGYVAGGEVGTKLYDRFTRPRTVEEPPDE